MSLREKLKALEELQQIDLDTTGVRGEAEGVPVRRAEIETAVVAAKKVYEAERSRLDDNERERRQIEAKALRKLRHPSRSKRLKSFVES